MGTDILEQGAAVGQGIEGVAVGAFRPEEHVGLGPGGHERHADDVLVEATVSDFVAGVQAVVNGAKTGTDIPKNIVTDGPVVTKLNAAGMLWMEDSFLI